MRCHMRNLYLGLAIMIIILSLTQSQEDASNNSTMANFTSPIVIEPPANITVASQVYEIDPNAFASFDDKIIEPAKQEIYNVTITNSGEVALDDVIVSLSTTNGMIFKNLAYYDSSNQLQLECNQFDLCQRASRSLIKNLGTLKSKESKSLIINAYVNPQVDNRQIGVKVTGAKPNGAVSDMKDIAKKTECVFVDSNGVSCAEKMEGCICQRPIWAYVFGLPVTKPLISLNRIIVTNTIYAIETADGEWHAPNMANIDGYIPSESDHVIYLISISNTDSNNSLKDILVFDELPDGMIGTSSSITRDGQASSQISPIVRGNNLTWEIDEIEPNTQVIIKHVAAFHRINDLRRFENKVYVNGTWDTEYALIRDQSQVVTSVIPAKT